jgi:hypothetical protein
VKRRYFIWSRTELKVSFIFSANTPVLITIMTCLFDWWGPWRRACRVWKLWKQTLLHRCPLDWRSKGITSLRELDYCKIRGSHCDVYVEYLLGYKTPVRTSQETHHVSVTEPSQLMHWKIPDFHCSDYEECSLVVLIRTTLLLARQFLSSWWWRWYIPLKRRFLQAPYCVTSHKTAYSGIILFLAIYAVHLTAAHSGQMV